MARYCIHAHFNFSQNDGLYVRAGVRENELSQTQYTSVCVCVCVCDEGYNKVCSVYLTSASSINPSSPASYCQIGYIGCRTVVTDMREP